MSEDRAVRIPRRGAVAFTAVAAASIGYTLIDAQTASAYAVEGCKWDHASPTYANYAYGEAGYGNGWDNMAQMWNDTSAPTTFKKIGSGDEGQADFAVYAGHYDVAVFPWLGVTFYDNACLSGGYFPNGKVAVNSYINRNKTDGRPNNDNNGTLGHELGHVLGLDHVNNVNALMHPYANERLHWTPQSDDIAGVDYLY